MTWTIIHNGHLCDFPGRMQTVPNTIVECDDCGQQWKLKPLCATGEYSEWVKFGAGPYKEPKT